MSVVSNLTRAGSLQVCGPGFRESLCSGGYFPGCQFRVTVSAWTRVPGLLTICLNALILILLCISCFFLLLLHQKKSYSFKYRCLGDHFEKCFLIFALFVIFFCSSVYKGSAAMVMISSVHEEKGSRVENKRHRSSLHKTLFSPDPPFCSGMAHL